MSVELPLMSFVVESPKTVQELEATVNSILSFSYPQIEIIIAGDHTSAELRSCIESYSLRYPFIVSTSVPAGGDLNIFNAAVQACNGHFIHFFEADQEIQEEFFPAAALRLSTAGERAIAGYPRPYTKDRNGNKAPLPKASATAAATIAISMPNKNMLTSVTASTESTRAQMKTISNCSRCSRLVLASSCLSTAYMETPERVVLMAMQSHEQQFHLCGILRAESLKNLGSLDDSPHWRQKLIVLLACLGGSWEISNHSCIYSGEYSATPTVFTPAEMASIFQQISTSFTGRIVPTLTKIALQAQQYIAASLLRHRSLRTT